MCTILSFFAELKRRNVFKVAAAYFIVAWLLLQISDTLIPALLLPKWLISAVALLLILGFPVAVIFAWAFELTPEGIRREKQVDRADSIAQATGEKINYTIIALLAITLAYFVWDKFDTSRDEAVETVQLAPVVKQVQDEPNISEKQPHKKSIAVLPFQNRSANEENSEFFSNGVHDELLTNLSRIGELKVISRTSVLNYRETTKNLRQIGIELGVAHILEGGVQRSGNTVRINVQLIDAASDEHLWAEVYERKLSPENIFAIQAEIAKAIVGALHAKLSPNEKKLLAATPTTSLEAYDDFLIAGQLIERGNWQSIKDAQSYLEKTIALDPNFVQAYVSLAETYFRLYQTGAATLQETIAPGEHAFNMALTLDSNNAGAHAARAKFLWISGREGVEAAFNQARQLEPANTDIMIAYANYLRKTSHINEAMQLYLLAKDLNPLSIPLLHGLARNYEATEEYDQALAQYAKIRQIDPSSSAGIGPTAGVYLAIGEIAKSSYWIFKGIEADPDDFELHNWVVRTYMDLGDYSGAGRWLDWIEKTYQTGPMTLSSRAMLEVYTGHLETAAELAEKALLEKLPNRWDSDLIMVRVLLMQAIALQQAAEGLEILSVAHPELFEVTPSIDADNVSQAIDTAYLLRLEGRSNAAESLLQSVMAFYNSQDEAGDFWIQYGKAQALAQLGEKQAALIELRSKVNKGMRLFWYWNTELNPNFTPLKDDPEFQAIVDFLRRDMAKQFELFQSMQVAGEIPSQPESDI